MLRTFRIDVRATSREILRTYHRHQHREMSLGEVAELTECSERTVVRHVRWLYREGYLTPDLNATKLQI
jgi:DNA-binding IclR family transcriptional regulator